MEDIWEVEIEKYGIRFWIPYRCHLARCPRCGPEVGRRMCEAWTEKVLLKPGHYFYVVLTLPGWARNNVPGAYWHLSDSWERLSRRFYRQDPDLEFIGIVERDKGSQYPHLNVVVRSEVLTEAWEEYRWEVRKWLETNARWAGLGQDKDIRPSDPVWDLSYCTKSYSSRPLQLPTNAPPGFKRFRASEMFQIVRPLKATGVKPKMRRRRAWLTPSLPTMPAHAAASMPSATPEGLHQELSRVLRGNQ